MADTGSTIGNLRRLGPAIVVAMLAAACSGPGSQGIDPVPSTTTSTTVIVGVPEAPVDPWALPPDHEVQPSSALPGPLPSFNESPGCDGPQGLRGPYATRKGRVPDAEAVWGPWAGYFGRDIDEVRSHLVEMSLPNGDAEPVTVFVHERAAPALQLVIDNLLREQERGNVYPLDPAATSSFNPRTVPPWRYMSFHTVGIAIDVNSTSNPYRADNTLVTDMPAWFVAAWTEAGWCWGGSWQDLKDPMHFSWKGPRAIPGYERYPPMPVRTGTGWFDRVLTFDTAIGATEENTAMLVADVDRDGAPDVVSLTPLPVIGGLDILAARAIHRFDTCRALGPTPYAPPEGAAVTMADGDGDTRPDLWVVGGDGDTVSVVVYTHGSGYTAHLPVRRTAIPSTPGSVYLVDDLDRDGLADLWVIEPGDPDWVSVWAAPGFELTLAAVALPSGIDRSWRFTVGDRAGDGVPDLFALGPDRLVVLDGAEGLAGDFEEIVTSATAWGGSVHAGDFDGDGRVDLYLVGNDGTLSVFLGGDRTGVPDRALMSWFLELDDQPWEYRQGCPFDPREPR